MSVRYIVGHRANVEREHPQYLVSSKVAPVRCDHMRTPPQPMARFPSSEDGRGMLDHTAFAIVRGEIVEHGRSVARETSDPVLVAQIDEAEANVEAAEALLASARRARQEVLDLVASRCRRARAPKA